MEIFNNIKNPEIVYAHKSKDNIGYETLFEHTQLTMKYAKKLIADKNLENIISNLGHIFFNDEKRYQLWYKLFLDTIIFHDVGKINENFQVEKMKNPHFKKKINIKANHSPLSAKIYFDYHINEVLEFDDEMLLYLFLNMYIISKHHGSLAEFKNFVDDFENIYEDWNNKKDVYNILTSIPEEFNIGQIIDWLNNTKTYIKENRKKTDWDFINIYIYMKLLFSLLVSSDFYSTSEFMNKKKIEDIGILNNVDDFISSFKKSEVYNGIYKYKQFKNNKHKNPFENTPINVLRSEMFLETEETLKNNLDKNIFYLEAPTGSGKTVCSLNLALNLLKEKPVLNKLFYIFPFNTLVEQTCESLKNIFGTELYNKNISIINSITPILKENEEKVILDNGGKIDYEQLLLDRQFLHSPIVVTTHINFFNYLFGLDREANFPIIQLANSVVIIDEIQAYKNNIWKEIIIFLKYFSKTLNIKIIIMSATLPKLDTLLPKFNTLIDFNKDEQLFCPLIIDKTKYYNHPLFSERVKLCYDFLNIPKETTRDEKFTILKEHVISSYYNHKKIVVEFISKKSAFEFFNLLAQFDDTLNMELLTGDDNKIDRQNIIKNIKSSDKPIILISTQVIEAGVDIDMDIGYKNISILDSEEQFLGRINRSCKKQGIAYFFEIDDPKTIYKGDVRANLIYSLKEKNIQNLLLNKNFTTYYKDILKTLNIESKKNNSKNIYEFKDDAIYNLDFLAINKRLKLISDKNEISVFLNREIKDKNISGKVVWNRYKNLLKDNNLSYAQKKIELSQIMELMDYFIYKVYKNQRSYSDNLGSIFYFDNSKEYFFEFNGKLKFNRQKFDNNDSNIEFI